MPGRSHSKDTWGADQDDSILSFHAPKLHHRDTRVRRGRNAHPLPHRYRAFGLCGGIRVLSVLSQPAPTRRPGTTTGSMIWFDGGP